MPDPARLLIVSADGHSGGPAAQYLEYFAPAERDEVAALVEEEEQIQLAQRPRGNESIMATKAYTDAYTESADEDTVDWALDSPRRYHSMDPVARVAELDRQGICAEILIPGHQYATLPLFSVLNRPFRAELRDAGTRAYHRWLADFLAAADGRLYGAAESGPCHDMGRTVDELRWTAERGFVCVAVPGAIEDPTLPPFTSDHYEPFWAACAELDLALMVHAGWGFPQGKFQDFVTKFLVTHLGADAAAQLLADGAQLDAEARAALRREFAEDPTSPLRLDFGPRRLLWQLMLAGVFDRYPTLRFVLTEVRSDWIPATLATLDAWFENHDTPLRHRPSEYWARHCFVTPSSIHQVEVDERHAVGVERLMFGVDYPHPEGVWPDTWNWIRAAFARVPEAEARAILGENAVRCFGLDRDRLASVAERIGPLPSDVLGPGHLVKPDHLAHFHQRAGFARPTEDVDTAAVLDLVQRDATAAVAGR